MNTLEATMAPQQERVLSLWLYEEGPYPNNPRLPALLYHQAFEPTRDDLAFTIERTFEKNGWSNGWRDGVYAFHHYHSTVHEVLGCYQGSATLQLGGPGGPIVSLTRGDVLVVPAGVAHRSDERSPDFAVVGSYAHGADWDMCSGDPDELPEVLARIASVRLPSADPVHGLAGPLLLHWREDG